MHWGSFAKNARRAACHWRQTVHGFRQTFLQVLSLLTSDVLQRFDLQRRLYERERVRHDQISVVVPRKQSRVAPARACPVRKVRSEDD